MGKRDLQGLTIERLRELLDYNPETGIFTWKKPRAGVKFGGAAGSFDGRYWKIQIDRNFYYAHRLVWLFVYGRWPDAGIDHVNLVGGDNRLANLREATPSQNSANRVVNPSSSSRLKGVQPFHHGKWPAKISSNGRRIYLGRFASPEEAYAAYCRAAKELFGEFARLE